MFIMTIDMYAPNSNDNNSDAIADDLTKLETIDALLPIIQTKCANAIVEDDTVSSTKYNVIANNIEKYIDENYTDPNLSIHIIATYVNKSANYTRNIFKQIKGISISDYITKKRFSEVCRLLIETNLTAQAISQQTGMSSGSYFYTAFKKYTGYTPEQFRKKYIGTVDEDRVKFLVAQEVEDEIEASLACIRQLCDYASTFQREKISCKELVIGMKCGGSDGLSGITANPTVGAFSDLLIARGGTTILTEVPEMFGAETMLMNRCRDEAVFDKTVDLINSFKNYFKSHNQTIYENPSPGNKKGGISTLEDKSLGCTQKSGSAPVADVLSYGQPVQTKGLNLLSAPGNDLVASTALAASGAQIVLFTTGRGTPFASPVPTVKISSNTKLYENKKNWIDFNCGALVDGGSIPEMGESLFDYVLEVASGRPVKAEEAGFHDMAIFKQGVTL